MTNSRPKQLRWVKQVHISASPSVVSGPHVVGPSTRERLLATLAERPRTVAQLAQLLGMSQPSALEHVRRCLRDGLISEVQVPDAERRYPTERYYQPTVPVIRQPDRDILITACRAVAQELADALSKHDGNLTAAFALTHLAREGWEIDDIWPYLHETIVRLATSQVTGHAEPTTTQTHGLVWVEDVDDVNAEVHVEDVPA